MKHASSNHNEYVDLSLGTRYSDVYLLCKYLIEVSSDVPINNSLIQEMIVRYDEMYLFQNNLPPQLRPVGERLRSLVVAYRLSHLTNIPI